MLPVYTIEYYINKFTNEEKKTPLSDKTFQILSQKSRSFKGQAKGRNTQW